MAKVDHEFRISYSLIRKLEMGDIHGAIRAFYGDWGDDATEAMIAGKKKHRKWELETNRTQRLPKDFGGSLLLQPKTEQYIKVEIAKDLWVSFVLDLQNWCRETDGLDITDYKYGTTSVSTYLRPPHWQHEAYHVAVPTAKRFLLRGLHPITKQPSLYIRHLTHQTLDSGVERFVLGAYKLRKVLEDYKLPPYRGAEPDLDKILGDIPF